MGHISKEYIDKLVKIHILLPFCHYDDGLCVDCVCDKLTNTRTNDATQREDLSEILHMNISGPYSTTLYGNR